MGPTPDLLGSGSSGSNGPRLFRASRLLWPMAAGPSALRPACEDAWEAPLPSRSRSMKGLLAVRSFFIMAVEPTKRNGVICMLNVRCSRPVHILYTRLPDCHVIASLRQCLLESPLIKCLERKRFWWRSGCCPAPRTKSLCNRLHHACVTLTKDLTKPKA